MDHLKKVSSPPRNLFYRTGAPKQDHQKARSGLESSFLFFVIPKKSWEKYEENKKVK